MNRPKLIFASALSAIVTIVFVTAITVAAEMLPALKDALKNLSGHHWTSKSLLSVAVYFVLLAVMYYLIQPTASAIRKSFYVLAGTAIVGYAVLVGFFLEHYL